jgi:2-polyprenyl-6-methoxyphenol hydroxylase-like FAD-dependent oxidoreductase
VHGPCRLCVVVLEKSEEHIDRVRGEFIVPWGVAEARQLGVLDLLERAGGNYTVKSVPYGEGTSPEQARAATLAMDRIVPDIRGALNFGHPRLCDTLNATAIESGATLLRGIAQLRVTPGQQPHVAFEHDGRPEILVPRIVISADGCGSAAARQAGLERLSDPVHHFFTGLLVDEADAWPSDEQANPNLALPFRAFQKGSFGVPASSFSEATWQELVG